MMPSNWVDMVAEFQKQFEEPFIPVGQSDWERLINLRASLIHEEITELWMGMNGMLQTPCEADSLMRAKVDTLDAICDSIYVLIGTANALGFDIKEAFDRVHKSNMTKLGKDGKPIYNLAGKVMKPESFKPPILEDLVA